MREHDTEPAGSRTMVIVNPTAGTTTPALVDDVLSLCRHHGRTATVHRTSGRGDATEAVTGSGLGPGDLVLVIGGDGTVLEVARGLLTLDADRRPTLFAVPGGTGNSGYRMLWGRRPWSAALSAVVRRTDDGAAAVRRVDMARLVETDDLVLLGACAGLFADALITARSSTRRGWARYEEALATTAARFDPVPARVTVDGTVIHKGEIVLANVGGGRHRAGQYQLLPDSLIDDGQLDVCVIGADGGATAMLALTRTGDHVGRPSVTYGRGRRIVVEHLDGTALCFEHDGEVYPGASPTMTLDVVPGALPMWGAEVAR